MMSVSLNRLMAENKAFIRTFSPLIDEIVFKGLKTLNDLSIPMLKELLLALQESQAALKVHASVSHTADGAPADPAVVVPLPVPGLASRRVLVMDYIPGTALNRLSATLKERGIEPGSPESELAGRRILTQLTEAFGRMMLGAGIIHGDPHPGNIFVMEGARVALIDCGQVKQISTEYAAQFWRNSGAILAQCLRHDSETPPPLQVPAEARAGDSVGQRVAGDRRLA